MNLLLDIHCLACYRGDEHVPPRLVRFVQYDGEPINVRPVKRKGEKVIPRPHERPDGGITWQLVCPRGHNRPLRNERIVAAFAAMAVAFGGGDGNWRRML
jgi:hypothetical protein